MKHVADEFDSKYHGHIQRVSVFTDDGVAMFAVLQIENGRPFISLSGDFPPTFGADHETGDPEIYFLDRGANK